MALELSDKQVIIRAKTLYWRRKRYDKSSYKVEAEKAGLNFTVFYNAVNGGLATPETMDKIRAYVCGELCAAKS